MCVKRPVGLPYLVLCGASKPSRASKQGGGGLVRKITVPCRAEIRVGRDCG